MPQSNADPATPHPSYFTTGHHRPPHGLRVICLKNPPKPDKYRKIHTRSFSGYDQQLPNNLGMSVPQSNANPATPHHPTSPQTVTGRHMVYGSLVLITLQKPINIVKFTQGLFRDMTNNFPTTLERKNAQDRKHTHRKEAHSKSPLLATGRPQAQSPALASTLLLSIAL